MFFNFTKKKVINISVLVGVLFIGSLAALSVFNKYNVIEATNLYFRRAEEDISYWWSNKIFGGGLASAVNYNGNVASARSIPVLNYHGLPDEGESSNPFSPKNFSEHMNALSNAGWSTITLDQFEEFVRGNITLPEKSFLLTFDDGRKDTFYPADPVLKDLDMNAVMFAITKRSVSPTEEQSPYYLSPYELRAMSNSNHWEVESHGRDSHDWYYVSNDGTVGHFFSNLLWIPEENRTETREEFRTRVSYDLSTSKRDLEATLNKEIRAFAYPFSDFGQDGVNFPEAVDIVREEVGKFYRMAFYQVWNGMSETFNYPDPDEVMMKRIEPLGDWSGEYLLSVLESGISKDIPYNSASFGKEWRSSWGTVIGGDTLSLSADDVSSGASVGLNGSSWWRDYVFKSDVVWRSGSNVVLIARREDDDNYFGCNFGRGKVYIKSVRDDVAENLLSADYNPPELGEKVNLGISVNGNRIQCLVNNVIVLDAPNVNTRISEGGVGLEVWDERNNVANAVFDNIEVLEN